MKARDVFSFSFGSIRLRKLRSGLTTLGIVIGIAAIVALMSYTQGFEIAITNQFSESFSTDTVTVSTRGFMGFPGSGFEPSDFTLHVNDTGAIETLDLVESTTAVLSKQVDLNSSEYELSMSVTGIDFGAYLFMYSTTFAAEHGEIPASPDNESVVIGHSVYDPWDNGTIFADIGDEITLSITIREDSSFRRENITLSVVGILEEIGTSIMGPSDNGIYIPIELAVEFLETDEINSIIVKLVDDSDATIDAAAQAIEDLFDGEVTVQSATALLDTISTALGTVELLLTGIAGISLLVAGVGIMNIMIVSLMERTREIGILKALGAKNKAVLTVFLSEALIIGFIGGIVGIIAGGAIAMLLSSTISGGFGFGMGGPGPGASSEMASVLTSITPVITTELVVMALFFGVVVSIIFGLYPAWRASKLRPVDALRYE